MSSLKTILLIAAFVVVMAGVFKIGGLKIWHGIGIAAALSLAGNLIPDTQQQAA